MLNLLSPTGSDVLGHFESRLGLDPENLLYGHESKIYIQKQTNTEDIHHLRYILIWPLSTLSYTLVNIKAHHICVSFNLMLYVKTCYLRAGSKIILDEILVDVFPCI